MKNKTGIIKTLMILLGVVMLMMPFCSISASAAHLNKYEVRLFAGESFKLKLEGTSKKVTFSSSKRGVATVNKKGLIKTHKRGSAVITAKCDGKKYKCKVTVINMMDSNKDSVRDLINKNRRDYGIASLSYNKYLANAAQLRAKEINASYSHTRPNKKSWTSAISMKYDFGKYRYEMIGRGFATPSQIVAAWMNNSDTRPAIIGRAYKDIGVGYYLASDGVPFWCVIVAKEK